jgi:transcription elongation GreA/GreB family factor
MAKAVFGHRAGPEVLVARLESENAALRSRVAEQTTRIGQLQEALSAATAVADGRLVDLVEVETGAGLDAAIRVVTEGAPA